MSKAPLESQAQNKTLFTSAASNQRVVQMVDHRRNVGHQLIHARSLSSISKYLKVRSDATFTSFLRLLSEIDLSVSTLNSANALAVL